MPALHHLTHAAADEVVRCPPVDALAAVFDRAFRDIAALGVQQVRDRLKRRRLARAVRAEQRDDAAFGHVERHAAQHEDDVIVDDLDVVDRKRNRSRGLRLRRHRGHRLHDAPTLPSRNRAA
jgi:hypothetical protein